MEITVNASKVTINKNSLQIHSGEYNINECIFNFSQEYTNLEKRAIFSNILDTKYLVEIKNDRCIIPEDILKIPGEITLGVYGYENTEDNKLHIRYSPEPDSFIINLGSYSDNAAKVIAKETALDLIKRVDNLIVQTDEAISNVNDCVDKANTDVANLITTTDSVISETIDQANTTLNSAIANANTAINAAIDRADSEVNTLVDRVDNAIDRTNTAIAKVNSITFELDENGYLILTEND